MELNIQYIDQNDQLRYLLKKLISIIRYENTYTFELLKKITLHKKAIIVLDGKALELSATDDQGYTLLVKKTTIPTVVNFETKSKTLREILAGMKTIDKAIAGQDFFISGSFEDTLNIYRIVMHLLSDAVLSFRLRNLWDEFLASWEENKKPLPFSSYETQHACYDKWIKKIPVNILETGI